MLQPERSSKTKREPTERDDQILKEARDRLKKAMNEDEENRRWAMEDLEFIAKPGAQWPEKIRLDRETDGRPCITTNKMPIFIDQVVGDQRMNRPSVKVIPVDSRADPIRASIIGGWIKNIEQVSKSDTAIDHGFEHAVACGYGAIRVVTDYESDDSFTQNAFIQKIENALAIYWGPHSEYDCSDAMYCFIVAEIDRDEFEETYGEQPMAFKPGDSRYVEGWCDANKVRVVEYFVKEANPKTIYLLEDGSVVDKLEQGQKVVKQRETKNYKIKWYLLSGDRILNEKDWVGKKYIPVIPIWGKEINVGGRRFVRGLIRNAKDPQRMYNYWNSCETEIITLAPKSPYLATAKQIEGHETQWNEAHRKNFPYLLVNPDPDAPGWPHREVPPQASSAMIERIRTADQEIRDTMGLQRASLGMQSNERSGVAIRERKMEGDVGTFAFIDNLARSVAHLGRVLVDMAPGILDTERIIRLGLEGNLNKFEAINVRTEDGKIVNDMSVGTYDVVVTVGPSFTTQRAESRESMKEFVQYVPAAGPLVGDLYAKSMDWQGADEFAERLEYLLPPEVRAKLAEKRRESGEEAPEVVPTPIAVGPPPDPLLEAKLQEAMLGLEELQIKIEQEKAKLQGLQLENQIKAIRAAVPPREVASRQEGGPVEAGQPVLVGEEGPGVIVPRKDVAVIPAQATSLENLIRTEGTWERENGRLIYTPSGLVLRYYTLQELMNYFDAYFPGAVLNLPTGIGEHTAPPF